MSPRTPLVAWFALWDRGWKLAENALHILQGRLSSYGLVIWPSRHVRVRAQTRQSLASAIPPCLIKQGVVVLLFALFLCDESALLSYK